MRPPEMMTEACCPSSRVMVFMLVPTGIPLSPLDCLSAGAGLAGLFWARDMLWGAASVVMGWRALRWPVLAGHGTFFQMGWRAGWCPPQATRRAGVATRLTGCLLTCLPRSR